MQLMGIRAVYQRPRISKPAPDHKVYLYLLRDLKITRPNQVWAADITYITMSKGFMYLMTIIDWYSRYVISWRLSNTLDTDFCVAALEEALSKGTPKIFNTYQGNQFTNEAFIRLLTDLPELGAYFCKRGQLQMLRVLVVATFLKLIESD